MDARPPQAALCRQRREEPEMELTPLPGASLTSGTDSEMVPVWNPL